MSAQTLIKRFLGNFCPRALLDVQDRNTISHSITSPAEDHGPISTFLVMEESKGAERSADNIDLQLQCQPEGNREETEDISGEETDDGPCFPTKRPKIQS
ncbi:hypothetical protein SNE40_000731 [Patella caerulea]|uniref:Uncharacterized protein n=1 Tax=Patella caerulea TaxID=87958 RepID=A0AAN8KHR3_PATCE